jgi:hypothetical protein
MNTSEIGDLHLEVLSKSELEQKNGGIFMYYAAAATILYFAGYGAHWAYDAMTN